MFASLTLANVRLRRLLRPSGGSGRSLAGTPWTPPCGLRARRPCRARPGERPPRTSWRASVGCAPVLRELAAPGQRGL